MVTGPIDLYTGGEGGKDPDEEANSHKRPGSVDHREGEANEKEGQTNKGDGRSTPV